MIKHLIVPVDESVQSWKAFDVAYALALRCGADLRLVQVEYDPLDRRLAADRLKREVRGRQPVDVDVVVDVRLTSEPVVSELDRVVNQHPDSVVVMASHGRGRSVSLPASMVVEDEDERGDDDVPRALIYTTLTPPRRRVFHVT